MAGERLIVLIARLARRNRAGRELLAESERILWCHPQCCLSGRVRLEKHTELVELAHLVLFEEWGGAIALEWQLVDQVIGVEPCKGFANGGRWNIELPGDVIDVDARTRRDWIVHDERLAALIDIIGEHLPAGKALERLPMGVGGSELHWPHPIRGSRTDHLTFVAQ